MITPHYLKNIDWITVLTVFFICLLGLLSIFSSSFARGSFLNFQKQIVFITVGFILMIGLSFFDYRSLKENQFLLLTIYFTTLIFLTLLYPFGERIRGVYGWFRFGPLTFQPVEFMKIVMIFVMSKYFSMRHIEMYRPRHIMISGIYVAIPSLLVFFQPDLGSAAILVFLWLGIMIVAGIKIRHLFLLALLGILIFILAWNLAMKPYQQERILSFLDPYLDPVGRGYNIIQAKIAIGNGGIFGQGIGYGSQTQYKFLPEPQTDFIFASIAEEFGLLGVLTLFLLFVILVSRIINLAMIVENNFARLIVSSFALLVFLQFFVNAGMATGMLPVVGIPLPFLSYGGSSLISFFIGLGILQSIKVRV